MTTTITITIILLAFLLGVTTITAIRRYYLVNKLRGQNDSLRASINRHIAAANDSAARYTIRNRISFADDAVNSEWLVCRTSTQDGHSISSCIKTFSDPDPEFNRRQAEELVDHLNEK